MRATSTGCRLHPMSLSASATTGSTWLYQPVNCGASGIVKQNDLIEFSAACRIKDYVADKRQRVLLKVEDADHIQFADQDFMVFGKYVRCSKTYACEKSWNK
jgi:hypothetical protein